MNDIIIDGILYTNYKVDKFGNIFTRYRCPGYRKMSPSKGLYLSVTISECGNKRSISIHRIVALTFIPNPHNLPEVNHKDGDHWNNHYSNLEWVTPSENIKHSYTIGNRKDICGENNPNHKSKKHLTDK